MKKLILLTAILFVTGCATTGKISSWGTNGKYAGPVVRDQHGHKMVIPNGGLPGIKSIINLIKIVK